MNSMIIDLTQAEEALSTLFRTTAPQQQQQNGYQPKTLNQDNRARILYLPWFPTTSMGLNDSLLLSNVPECQLTPRELARRQPAAATTYTADVLMLLNNYNYSSKHLFTISDYDMERLAQRLKVHPSIIIFNAERFRHMCYHLCGLRESFRRTILQKKPDRVVHESPFYSKDMTIALEIFLQIDVDLFFMKTCSFRGAQPLANDDGLFCRTDPQTTAAARYAMIACGHRSCECCHPINVTKRPHQTWPVVDFASSSMHRFVNGYTTYLNCPATCTTTNVIFSLTCPCGQYDFIDSTASTLADAMHYHRYHVNRIIHEKLTGSSLYPYMKQPPYEKEDQIGNKMRLYQHSARCPSALRSFLECNPDYWCFIPLSAQDATQATSDYFQYMSHLTDQEQIDHILKTNPFNKEDAIKWLRRVPASPATYSFSCQQREQQRLFFQKYLSMSIDQLPYSPLDLYQVATIAVLPNNCSNVFRFIIETLFIIHGETKLNMICPIGGGGDPEIRYGRPDNTDWCANLKQP